jgi:hypothetical protein
MLLTYILRLYILGPHQPEWAMNYTDRRATKTRKHADDVRLYRAQLGQAKHTLARLRGEVDEFGQPCGVVA